MDVRDGTHDSPKYVSQGYPLITSKNLKNGIVDMSDVKYIAQGDYEFINERSRVDTGDILFAMIGSIGNPSIVGESHEYAIKNVALLKKVCNEVFEQYIYWYMQLSQYAMKKAASGGVQPFVSLSFLRAYPMPLPPLEEQKRIVARVEELLALCDQLKK
jgi:type I restriction enzyme S subunit